jgi:glycosyltransferase involved in cell wall biosynthesis
VPAADRRPRVAIDARYWRSTIQTGVERYILIMLEALATVAEHIDVSVVVREQERDAFRAAAPGVHVVTVPSRHEHAMRRALDELGPDLVHYPFDLPRRFGRPSVYTLHDPGRYLYPHLMVRRIRDGDNDRLREHLTDPNLRAVVTVSEASRTDIIGVLGHLPQPLAVVPNFVTAAFAHQLHAAHETPPPVAPFLLAVGVYIPTKNIPRLVRAFRSARASAPDVVPPRLCLVGRLGWEHGFPRNGAADITVLRHVSNEHLAQLYATCTAFIWPSFYEGFGIPILEALTAGARILCSDIPVHHEVAGTMATFTDPYDDDAMAKAIIDRCQQPGPPTATAAAHLSQFTAAAAGNALLDIYRHALAR